MTVIRTLFRRVGLDGALTAGFVRDTLHVSEPKPGALLLALAKAGFLKREEGGSWRLMTTGIRLRGATAAKPLLRQTVERLLENLLQRIARLNEDSRFLARVEKGNPIRQLLERRRSVGRCRRGRSPCTKIAGSQETPYEANDRRVAEEEQKGRRFRSFLDQAFWWEQEAMLFLRNRRRGLSLQHHGSIREAVEASPHSLIVPKPGSIL